MRLNQYFRLRVHAKDGDGDDDINEHAGAGITGLDNLTDFLDRELDGGDGDADDNNASNDSKGAGTDDAGANGAGKADAGAGWDGERNSDKGAGDASGDAGAADGTKDGKSAATDNEAGDSDQGDAGKDVVPLATLLDERKYFQTQLREMERKFGRFEGLQEKLNEFVAEKGKAAEARNEDPQVEYMDDPKAYIDGLFKRLGEQLSKQTETVVDIKTRNEQQTQIHQLTTALTQYDTQFVESKPDYYDALDYVRQINVQNALDLGYNDAQANQQAAQAMFAAQVQAMRAGKNPAEFMYGLAKRFRYEPATDTTGGDKDKADPAADKKRADAALETLIKGQDAGSLGPGGSVDLDELADAEDDEFTEIMESVFGKGSAR